MNGNVTRLVKGTGPWNGDALLSSCNELKMLLKVSGNAAIHWALSQQSGMCQKWQARKQLSYEKARGWVCIHFYAYVNDVIILNTGRYIFCGEQHGRHTDRSILDTQNDTICYKFPSTSSAICFRSRQAVRHVCVSPIISWSILFKLNGLRLRCK